MDSKTILITGATDGIGKVTTLELAGMGHHVLVHGRNEARGKQVADEIKRAVKHARVNVVSGDLASLDEVRTLAAQVKDGYPRLDVLINNAGVFRHERTLTRDELEMTFAVNYLAHFLLTNLLLESLKASAPARIIHVSSGTHRSAKMDWGNLQGEKKYDGYEAYARSKLENVLYAYALAERLRDTGVTSNALHPGVIRTKLLNQGWGGGGTDLKHGGDTLVYAATAPELETVTGKYFDNRREATSSAASHDTNLQQKLWETSERLTSI